MVVASTLQLVIVPSVETNDHQVKILVDGVDLLGPLGAIGLDPDDLFRRESGLIAEIPTEKTIGRCECGCLGCGDIKARVETIGSSVRWVIDVDGRVLSFSRSDYETEVRRAACDHSWETPERTAARLFREELPAIQDDLDRRGLRFDWASGRVEPWTFTASFTGRGGQRLLTLAMDGDPPERLAARMLEKVRSELFGAGW